MCEKCLNAARRYFPSVAESDFGELLMSATSYPFGDRADIARQLRNLARRKQCDGTLDAACAIAEGDLHKQMRHMQPNNN